MADPSDTQNSASADEPSKPSSDLMSEAFKKMREDLRLLYIPNNQSGRNHFSRKHPIMAEYIFGTELMRYDTEGVGAEKDHRDTLEAKAEDKHHEVLDLFEEIEENSSLYGSLKVEYVKEIIDRFGRELSLKIYHETIVNRIYPAPKNAKTPDTDAQGGHEEDSGYYSGSEAALDPPQPMPAASQDMPQQPAPPPAETLVAEAADEVKDHVEHEPAPVETPAPDTQELAEDYSREPPSDSGPQSMPDTLPDLGPEAPGETIEETKEEKAPQAPPQEPAVFTKPESHAVQSGTSQPSPPSAPPPVSAPQQHPPQPQSSPPPAAPDSAPAQKVSGKVVFGAKPPLPSKPEQAEDQGGEEE